MKSLLADKGVLGRLEVPDPLGGGRMHDRVQAVALLRERVGGQKLIEGWIEGPCAEAADLRGINRLMTDFYDDPAFVRDLFDFVLAMGLEFARAQVDAGADLIGVGDAAASLVGPQIYEEFVRPYEQKMVDGLHAMGTQGAVAHLRQHPPHPAQASAASAARSSILIRWCRLSRPGKRWDRRWPCWATSTR